MKSVLTNLNELLQLGAVLQFGVAVKKQSCVICIGKGLPVEGLQVCSKVVYSLGIQELSDDVWGFQFPNGSTKRKTIVVDLYLEYN